jgi:hypothetical protein
MAKRIQDRVYLGRVVGRGGQVLGYAAAVEDVLDLAYGRGLVSCVLYAV